MRNADIVPFPARAVALPAAQPPVPARSASEIGLAEIAHRLGLAGRTPRTIVDHLRTLAEYKGFPLPKTARRHHRRPVTGPRLIVAGALWDRYTVDLWFDDRDPPGHRAALQQRQRDELREDMARRAREIGGGGRIAARAQ